MIPGLENDPLVPGDEMLGLAGFWAAQILLCAGCYSPRATPFRLSPGHDSLLAQALGVGG